jgi:hypothetical protein
VTGDVAITDFAALDRRPRPICALKIAALGGSTSSEPFRAAAARRRRRVLRARGRHPDGSLNLRRLLAGREPGARAGRKPAPAPAGCRCRSGRSARRGSVNFRFLRQAILDQPHRGRRQHHDHVPSSGRGRADGASSAAPVNRGRITRSRRRRWIAARASDIDLPPLTLTRPVRGYGIEKEQAHVDVRCRNRRLTAETASSSTS